MIREDLQQAIRQDDPMEVSAMLFLILLSPILFAAEGLGRLVIWLFKR